MTRPITFGARTSFALIGYAGSYKPSWITQAHAPRGLGPSMVTASIELGTTSLKLFSARIPDQEPLNQSHEKIDCSYIFLVVLM